MSLTNNIAVGIRGSEEKPMYVVSLIQRFIRWVTDVSFNLGNYTDTEVIGTGEAALIQLEFYGDNDDDILYNDSGKYTPSDSGKIDAGISGKASLKIIGGIAQNYPFTTPANYTYNASKIVVNGDAELVGSTAAVDLEAYWKMDEASWSGIPDEVEDSSLNTNDGRAVNGAQTVAGGIINRAGSFDGINDNISIPHDATLDFETTDPFSFQCWVKCTTGGWRSIMSQQQVVGSYGINFQISPSGQIRMNLVGSSGSLAVDSTNTVDDTFWHHIIMTYDGSELASGVIIYIDGSAETPIVIVDSLAGSILTTVPFRLADREALNQPYAGLLDEAAVWSRVLAPSEVSSLWNGGSGLEIDFFSTDNPTIVNNTGLVFTITLDSFVETATKPGGTELKYQVSHDNGTTWKWWNGGAWVSITGGQTDTWYFNNEANLASVINTNIGTLAGTGTFKFRAFLNSDGASTPELDNLLITSVPTYSTDDNLYIDTKDTAQIAPAAIVEWLTTTITNNKPANTDIKLLFSVDGRVNWLTWGGAVWEAPTSATARSDATSITDAQTNFANLPLGNGTLDVRLFLYTSNNAATPDVDNINVTSSAGFKTSGEYESNEYDSTFLSLDWGIIEYSIVNKAGTTLSIKARAGNESGSLGAYSAALVNGQETNITGRFLQWKAEFTSTGVNSSEIDSTGFNFTSPGIVELNP
jgi:hypothetical protein